MAKAKTKTNIKVIGAKPELAWVNVEDINIIHNDQEKGYQRKLNSKVINTFVRKGFFWGAVKTISIARRKDGTLWAYDGQHTIALLVMAGYTKVPCLIQDVDTIEEEAMYFSFINTNRRNPTAFDKFKADVVAGNADALKVVKILSDLGLTLSENPVKDPTYISCPGVMRNAIARYSKNDVLKDSLAGLMEVFVGDQNRFAGDIVHGACSFTNQATMSGKLTAREAWEKVGRTVKRKKVDSSTLQIMAGQMVNISAKKSDTRKTFVADILMNWAGLKK